MIQFGASFQAQTLEHTSSPLVGLWTGCMSQCLSLKISPSPNNQAHSYKRKSPKQPENSFSNTVWGIWAAPNGLKARK
jgi:hypothetical protein